MSGSRHLFCFGYGYTAGHLARMLKARGWSFSATGRTQAALDAIRRDGGTPVSFTGQEPIVDFDAAFTGVDHVLSAIPPHDETDPVIALHGRDLASLSGLEWAGYLSTTGVYGDRGGGWVDESAELAPSTARGHARAHAERAWQEALPKVQIFRLSGIYGPGRNQLENLKAGTARRIVKRGQVFGRIHVADITAILYASIAAPRPGAIYNVTDDEPAPPQDVIAFAAALLSIEPPAIQAFETADLSPMAASFYAENKRVSNRLIKREFGLELQYPTYREGLEALARALKL
jgi:nucleoside-diphosphate-sugar epimerase